MPPHVGCPRLVHEATEETCEHRAAALHVGTASCDGDQTSQGRTIH